MIPIELSGLTTETLLTPKGSERLSSSDLASDGSLGSPQPIPSLSVIMACNQRVYPKFTNKHQQISSTFLGCFGPSSISTQYIDLIALLALFDPCWGDV